MWQDSTFFSEMQDCDQESEEDIFSVSKYLKIICSIYYILWLQLFLFLSFLNGTITDNIEKQMEGKVEWIVGEKIKLSDKTGISLSNTQ